MAGSSSVRGARVRKWLEVVNEEEGVAKCSGTEWYKHVTEELCPCKNVSVFSSTIHIPSWIAALGVRGEAKLLAAGADAPKEMQKQC